MGLPKDLSPEQIRVLKSKAADVPESTTEVRVGADRRFVRTVKMQENDIVFISLKKR
jgi:hypothetical protein